jgi:hypothetical protein
MEKSGSGKLNKPLSKNLPPITIIDGLKVGPENDSKPTRFALASLSMGVHLLG